MNESTTENSGQSLTAARKHLSQVASEISDLLDGRRRRCPCRATPLTRPRIRFGLTYFVPGTTSPLRIEFAPDICVGLIWLAASPAERAAILRLNPSWTLTRFETVAGLALVVVLHETHHASGDRDEAHTQACAMKALPTFAAQVAPADEVDVMLAAARAWDATLPATYKGATC